MWNKTKDLYLGMSVFRSFMDSLYVSVNEANQRYLSTIKKERFVAMYLYEGYCWT